MGESGSKIKIMRNSLITVIALFFLKLIPSSSLSCYQCSTVTDPDCVDPIKTNMMATTCPKDKEYTICRRIHQEVRGNVTVIRNCGWIENENECYSTRLDEFNTLVCQCKENMCNTANKAVVMSTILIISGLFHHLVL